MLFIKSYNNSVALVEREDGSEVVVVGKGIGFGLKKGVPIDQSKIERVYISKEDNGQAKQASLLKEQAVKVTDAIISEVEPFLNIKFDDYQYLALADHVNFLLVRLDEAIDIENGILRWQAKKLYPNEYEAAKKAIKVMQKDFGLTVPQSEKIFLTYHFVNVADNKEEISDTMKISELIVGILDIIRLQYQQDLDEKNFNYERFMTHLRSFMINRITKSQKVNELDDTFANLIMLRYPKAFETVEKIGIYLKNQMNWDLTADDKVYLTIHVWRVTQEKESKKSVDNSF